jgi:hypothetical protein
VSKRRRTKLPEPYTLTLKGPEGSVEVTLTEDEVRTIRRELKVACHAFMSQVLYPAFKEAGPGSTFHLVESCESLPQALGKTSAEVQQRVAALLGISKSNVIIDEDDGD